MDIDVDELTVTVSGRRLVDEVSLSAASGERVGLVGPNGSGKSSTLRCLFRALRPSHGDVRIGERDVRAMSLRESAQLIAALTQESYSEFDFTVTEVVAMGRTPHHRRGRADEEVCARALREVNCTHLATRGFQALSGGEKQRVLIARAFAQQPQVLVLDEPTNHLDIRHQLEILELVRRLRVTTVVALHDLNLAASWCDRVYVLDEGRVVSGGPPRQVLTPDTVRAVFGVEVHVVDHPTSGVAQLLFDTHAPAAAEAPN